VDAAVAVVNGDGGAGPIQEQLFSGAMLLPQDHILLLLNPTHRDELGLATILFT
jgi:hypothetical protein